MAIVAGLGILLSVAAAYGIRDAGWPALAVPVLGILMTALVSRYLLLFIGRNRDVTAQLAERSNELSRTNRLLEQEVTNRELAEDAAERAHGRLIDAIESISDGFVLWDADDRLVVTNEKMMTGHAIPIEGLAAGTHFDDYIRMSFNNVARSESGGSIETWLQRRRRWHQRASGAEEFRMRNGRWMQVSERRTKEGATVAIYTDITLRRRAEAQLKRSEGRLAHAERLAGTGCWEWTQGSNALVWSDELYTLMAWADHHPPTILGYLDMVHDDDRDSVEAAYRRIFEHGGGFDIEYRIQRPDGRELQFKSQAEAVVREDGVVERVIGAVHDISELKRVEFAMREAKDTAELANRSKSEFLANMSHEVRTPLNAIMGFSEVMKNEVFGALGHARYREYADDILQSGIHLLELINDILDLARVEAGKLDLYPEDVDVEQAMRSCLRLTGERAEHGGLTLELNVARDLPLLSADERKLKQIFLNLLTNAVKFTPAGGRVTAGIDHDGAGGVTIAVADTGIGIPTDQIPKALSAFGQVDSALTRKVEGTGLGLPLTKSLVELHGGWLDIESTVGIGTTVTVHFPRIRQVA